MTTLDDLLEPVTADEWKASIYEVLSITGVDVTAWKPGAVTRTIVTACAMGLGVLSLLVSQIAAAGWLAFARGFWLTLLARHYYGIERELATFGRCMVNVINSKGGVYEFAIGEFIISNPDTGKSYRNVAAFDIGANTAVNNLIFESIESGAASTSTVGTIVQAPPLDGVSCTNTTSCICRDEELDQSLIDRCKLTLGSRSPLGPAEAYELAAREAKRADGTTVGVSRYKSRRDGKGNVWCYVANANGAIAGDPEDIGTDLGAINDNIQRKATPLCVTARTVSARAKVLDIEYTAYLRDTAGMTPAQVSAAIVSALGAHAGRIAIGGTKVDEGPGKFFLDAARVEMSRVLPDALSPTLSSVLHVEFTSPANDVELAFNEVVQIGTVTPTIVFKNQSVA